MKLYFAVLADNKLITSVSDGTPMDLLKQLFISCPAGEFNLSKPVIADRVAEINELFNTTFAGMTEPVEVIAAISHIVMSKRRDESLEYEQEATDLEELLMLPNLSDDQWMSDFFGDLRGLFWGTEYEVSSETEQQTTLIVRIEL